MRQLDEHFQNEINFRVIGPLPPYSFSAVEVSRLTLEQLAAARQTLHLEDVISETDVRKSYRRLAAEHQRNLKPGDEPAKARFVELRRASELLLRYCQARKGSQRDGLHPASANQGNDCLFSVAVKGARSDEIDPARFGGFARV